jgi:microcystin degradation protein MlrC
MPSNRVSADAFARICNETVADLRAALADGLDGIYLDLHGAAVAQGADDAEGELLQRLRALAGPTLPIVASLDLHANVTRACCRPMRWWPTAPTRTSTWRAPASARASCWHAA